MQGITRRSMIAGSIAALSALAVPCLAKADDATASVTIPQALVLEVPVSHGPCTVVVPASWSVYQFDGMATMIEDPDESVTINFASFSLNADNDPDSVLSATESYLEDLTSQKSGQYRILACDDGKTGESVSFFSAALDENTTAGILRIEVTDDAITIMLSLAHSDTGVVNSMLVFEDMWASRTYGEKE